MTWAIIALLAVTTGIGWWRYAEVPWLAGYDEVFIHDAALGWAKTGKLAAPSFEGTPLARTFSTYPPLYTMAQGLIYRGCGFEPLTLRGFTRLGMFVSSLLGLLVLRSLWRQGLLMGSVAAASAVLWLTDWVRFWNARQARMEPWETAFGVGAALVLTRGREEPRRWYCAAVLVGLALATHLSAAIFYIPLVVGLWLFRRSLGWGGTVAVAVLPVMVLVSMWLLGFRGQSWEAFLVFRRIYSAQAALPVDYWLDAFHTPSLRGGLGYAVPVFWLIPLGGAVCLWWAFRGPRYRWGIFLTCSILAQLAGIMVYGTRPERVMLMTPLALVVLGSALSGSNPKLRQACTVGALVLGAAELAASGAYVTYRQGTPPPDFEPLRIFDGRPVAATTELWWEFMKRGVSVHVVATDNPGYGDYWRDPQNLVRYRTVVLDSPSKLLPAAEWTKTEFRTSIGTSYVYERNR